MIINNPISLLCEALPFPSPNITWLKDEVPVRASSNVLLLPGTVLLSPGSARLCWPLALCALGSASGVFARSGWDPAQWDGENSSSRRTRGLSQELHPLIITRASSVLLFINLGLGSRRALGPPPARLAGAQQVP